MKQQEPNKQIVSYLEKNIKKGYKTSDLKWALINQKHSKVEIERAIKFVESRMPKPVEEKKIEIEDQKEELIIIEKKGFFKRLFGKN